MAQILLARHGETDWNREHRIQGQTDIPLNATGLAQAQALAEELADEGIVAVYASDLSRAFDTAAAVAARHTLQVSVDVDLREKNFGSWEGLTDVEIRERFPDAQRGAWGDGETTEEVAERVVGALSRIRQAHASGLVLVVGHGGSLRAALAHFGVQRGPIRNGEVIRVDV